MKSEQAITKTWPPCSSSGVKHNTKSTEKVNRLHSKPPLRPTAQQREDTRCSRTKHIPDLRYQIPWDISQVSYEEKIKGEAREGIIFIRFLQEPPHIKNVKSDTERTHPCAKTFRPPAPRTPPSLGPSKILMIAMKQCRKGKE